MHNWDGYGGWGRGGLVVMAIMMIVFWGAVAWVIVTLVRHTSARPVEAPPRPPATAPSDAHRILDERYARGEIDDEEYRRRRTTLRGAHDQSGGV